MGKPCGDGGLPVVPLVKGFALCGSPVPEGFLKKFSDYEDIISCEWTKELFVKYSDPALIKSVDEKYEVLDGL